MFQNIVFVMQRQKIWEGGRKRKMANTVVTLNLTPVVTLNLTPVTRNWLALEIHDILDLDVIEVQIELNHNAILGVKLALLA